MKRLVYVLSAILFVGLQVCSAQHILAAACDPVIYFAPTDPTSGNVLTQVPREGSIMLYMKLTAVPADCNGYLFEKVGFNQIVNNNPMWIGDAPLQSNIFQLIGGIAEYKLPIQVSGLKDAFTGQPVQAGGRLAVQGVVKFTRESNFRSSSIVNIAIQAASVSPNPPGPNPNPPPATSSAVTEGQIVNPISYDSLGELIVAVIRFLLIMVGSLSVLFIIIGAVRMVTSAGNEKAVTAGKQTIQWAVLGLVVALMSFSIIAMVQSLIGRK